MVGDGHEADEAGDDGRLEVLQHNVVGVPVSFNHLEENKHTLTSGSSLTIENEVMASLWINEQAENQFIYISTAGINNDGP